MLMSRRHYHVAVIVFSVVACLCFFLFVSVPKFNYEIFSTVVKELCFPFCIIQTYFMVWNLFLKW